MSESTALPERAPKITVTGLRKSFGTNEVLKGIDAVVSEGEVVCVIGPSGSGKSTFLRCLNKLEDITAGHVVVDGFDLADPKVDIDEVRQPHRHGVPALQPLPAHDRARRTSCWPRWR